MQHKRMTRSDWPGPAWSSVGWRWVFGPCSKLEIPNPSRRWMVILVRHREKLQWKYGKSSENTFHASNVSNVWKSRCLREEQWCIRGRLAKMRWLCHPKKPGRQREIGQSPDSIRNSRYRFRIFRHLLLFRLSAFTWYSQDGRERDTAHSSRLLWVLAVEETPIMTPVARSTGHFNMSWNFKSNTSKIDSWSVANLEFSGVIPNLARNLTFTGFAFWF